MIKPEFVFPDWPAPATIHAAVTTRIGGTSAIPYDNFNLALHVGESQQVVAANRKQLRAALKLPAEPQWLKQVHGVTVVDAAASKTEP